MAERMIAYCGLVCSECPAREATLAGDAVKIGEIAKMWSKEFGANVKAEHVWCDGCTAEGRKCAHCGQCEVRACAMGKGVENCAVCGEYGCEILTKFHAMAPQAKEVLESLRG